MSPDERPIENLIDDYTSRRIDRRGFLQRAFALGLSAGAAGSILAACGGDEAPEAAPPPPATEGETPPATTAAEEPAATTAAEEPPAAPQGGTLRFRIRSDILTLDPAFAPGSSEEETASGIYEGLLAYKPGTWELANQLAETFEPSADGLQFTFKLKEGIPFHKGYGEVTAEDVKFSFERVAGLTKPNIESPYSGDWVALQEVRVDGTYEGTIILKEQFAPLTRTTLPAYYGGSILSKKAVTELGEEYALNPVGTGPYEFVEWQPKQRVLLKRFAEWGGASSEFVTPQWDELEAIPIDEDAAADIALETGELDFGEIALASVERFEENDDFTVGKYVTFDYSWIGMNLRDPALQDVNVRQALRYAIDVPAIIDGRLRRALGPGNGTDSALDGHRLLGRRPGLRARRREGPGVHGAGRRGLSRSDPDDRAGRAGDQGSKRDRPGKPRRDRHQPRDRGSRLVGVFRSLERRGPAQPSAVLHQLRLGARSLVVDRVVHQRSVRPVELDVLVRAGSTTGSTSRGSWSRTPRGETRSTSRCSSSGTRPSTPSGSPGRHAISPCARESRPRSDRTDGPCPGQRTRSRRGRAAATEGRSRR